jgi:uncharacterized repeat protein (TIGR01451 family)
MKKSYLLLISLLLLGRFSASAQAYVTGDITAFPLLSANHDSTQCASFATEMYSFTIANSFLGDQLIIKDQNTGLVMTSATNTTGANPWMVTLMPMSLQPVVPDFAITGGMAVFGGTPMKFICGSDTISNVFSFLQLPVTNPCQYGNVSGRVYIDNNADCAYNTGDVPLVSVPAAAAINFTTGSGSQYGYSNANGQYNMQLQQSWMTNYTVSIPSNYQFIFPATTCSPASYSFSTLPQTNVDFSLQCSSQIDVQSAAMAPPSVRPGIPFLLHPYVSNTGCDTATGVLTLIKDPNTVYNAAFSANPATYVNGDTLKWNFVNLTNLSTGAYWNSFMAGVHLTPNTTVNIGDTLCFTITSTVLSNDVNAANNQYTICIPVVNSYDPNVKEVSPKGLGVNGQIPTTTNHLDYTIHFQNTGTAPAINVSVIDTLDADLLPSSLRILGASHTMSAQWLSSNVVKFNFNNIMLSDSITNEPKSHGQVRFSINLKSGLAVGTQLTNKASIYFDSNPAIVTNTAINTLAILSGLSPLNTLQGVMLYPNPASSQFSIDIPTDASSLRILSVSGQVLRQQTLSRGIHTIAIQDLNAGIYFVQVNSGEQQVVKKLIKE